MTTPADPDGSWPGALAGAWAQAIAESGYVPMGLRELRELVRGWAAALVAALTADPPSTGAALRVGAHLVDAHLTDPAALQATLVVLDTHLPSGRGAGAVRAAVAAGYAAALRRVTLVEQERLAQAIIAAKARMERLARQSEARFRAIFAGAAVGIGISDSEGRIVQVNQALADMLGYTTDEMRALTVPEMTHPTDPPQMWELYARMASGDIDHVRLEKAYYRKDGEVVWTDLTVSMIRDDDGRPLFNVAIMDDITERHEFQARLRHQALHDPLTGLPNRTLFVDRLSAAVDTADPAARIGICYLDLDGFKGINDTLGHDVGDRLLVTVAERLGERTAAQGHLAARMGGDEFVILVDRSAGADQLVAVAEAALEAVAVPVRVGPHRLRVSASVGVVERPAAGAEPAEILKAADVTLYRAKAEGRGRWSLYDAGAAAEQVARYELAAALPDALERGEFSLMYQPIVRLSDGVPAGLEALVRWNHPRLGTLTPDRFIALAEETGQIVPLGRYVLRQACREAAVWAADLQGFDLFVSVNVAAAQTHEPSLIDDVREILAETGLKTAQLQLELTESAVMATSGAPIEALRAIADTGVRIAIDDFGTGYSNLAYLRSLPVHAIKLPQPLIEGLRDPSQQPDVDERIVDALIRLAHAIDLTVTAEGVETPAQAQRLRVLDCDNAQGWHISFPCPAGDVTGVLRRLPRR